MQVALEIIAVVLLLDFVSGVFHWLEDSYGKPEWPLLGKWVTIPNIIHHHEPTYFTRHSWFKSAEILLLFGIGILAVAWFLDVLTWQVLLFVAIGINANEIHKWNHLPHRKISKVVSFLQRSKILQTPSHHARHHKDSKDTNYCVITNIINPLLESVDFWRKLERFIFRYSGIEKRPDLTALSSRKLGELPQCVSYSGRSEGNHA